jgi:hypothetical protein
MATQTVQHVLTNANAEIVAPTDMTNFTTDYKTTRNKILTANYNNYNNIKTEIFTAIQGGTYNFIVSTETNVTINVETIKTKLNDFKKKNTNIET